MNRPLLLAHLAQVERHIREGERHILRQRQIVDALERHGRGQSQTAKMARDTLDLFEMAQAAHVADPGAPRSCITADNIRSRWRATASAAVVCRSNRVESTVNSHKEYHHGASHKVVSFEQPRPYAAAGR